MNWYANEIFDGLTKLFSLGLDRTPASDSVQLTALAWVEATTVDYVWEKERDTPRIRASFITLQRTRDSWPAPKHFLENLPRVDQRAIGYEVKPVSRAEADARLAEIRRILDEGP